MLEILCPILPHDFVGIQLNCWLLRLFSCSLDKVWSRDIITDHSALKRLLPLLDLLLWMHLR